jgi:hypothetical protein
VSKDDHRRKSAQKDETIRKVAPTVGFEPMNHLRKEQVVGSEHLPNSKHARMWFCVEVVGNATLVAARIFTLQQGITKIHQFQRTCAQGGIQRIIETWCRRLTLTD